MKAFIPYFCLIIVVQLCACATQSDPFSQEKNTTKAPKNRTLLDEKEEEVVEVLEEEEPQASDVEPIDDKTTTITKKNPSSGSNSNASIPVEDAVTALSVITYSNVIESASAELPVQGQKVKLMIKNNHQQAMWYLMPVSGEKTMPENGQFNLNSEAIPPFLAKQYGTADRKLIELIYHGDAAQSFRAFYIQAGSSLLFRNYDLGNYQEGEYVPFWAIKGLEVNNETSLETWLPFSVASSPDVVVHNTTESAAAKWVDASKDAVFSKPNIKFVQANGIKKYQIPVGVIR